MSSSAISATEFRTTYRKVYKASLRAVQYSQPARYVVRDCVRAAFRDECRRGNSLSFFYGRPSTADPAFRSPTTTSTSTTSTTSSTSSISSAVGSRGFDRQRIARTLGFLEDAAESRGQAHKIVKNLMHARYWQIYLWKLRWRPDSLQKQARGWNTEETREAVEAFEETVRGLNQSMGMCLQV